MKIGFILSHSNGRTYHLLMSMSAIIVQTNPNWTLHVVCNGPVTDLDFIKQTFSNVPNIRYSVLDKHYDIWGHECRNHGVREATEDWIAMSSNDNYYVPAFVEEVLKMIEKNPQAKFVYTDMIHNHYQYNLFKSFPSNSYIDFGNMVTKPELARQIPLQLDQSAADGIFVEEYIERFCEKSEVCYIPHILYAHN